MSLQSSYWAGFIAADGCIYPPEHKLSIELSNRDCNHLQRFVDDIGWDGAVRYRDRTSGRMCRVQIGSSRKYIQDLQEIYNITRAKTYTLKPPDLDTDHKYAYLVGLIDGDGCIGTTKGNPRYPELTIVTASLELASWLNTELNLIADRTGNSIYTVGKTHFVKYSGCYARIIILKLKEINVSKLERKWNRYDFYMDEQDIRVGNASIHIDTVHNIRTIYTGNRSDITRIADYYGISRQIVYRIVSGRSWGKM